MILNERQLETERKKARAEELHERANRAPWKPPREAPDRGAGAFWRR